MTTPRQALALEYGQNITPIVSAKGEAEVAMEMIAQARRHGVFITQDPQLLALLSQLDVDQEIPPELYRTVSVILAWVYWLKNMRPGDEKLTPKNQASDAQASL
jgi:flagellar biosynthesis protein